MSDSKKAIDAAPDEVFDPEKFRTARSRKEDSGGGNRPRSRKWRREFVQVPWPWVEQLQSAKRVSTWRLAVLLLYEHWRVGGDDIALSNILAQDVGLARRSKSRGLRELETLDLIQVERRFRAAPRIALKHLKRGNAQ